MKTTLVQTFFLNWINWNKLADLRRVLFIYFFLFSFKVLPQYTVTVSSATYAPLSGATQIAFTSQEYYYSTNFEFPTFYTRNGDFNQVPSVPSLGAWINSNGYIAVYDKPAYQNTIVYYAFYNPSFTTKVGLTTVSSLTEGVAPNRILKFQWKDVVFNNDTTQKANFQAWFHEYDSAITYHFGANTLVSSALQGRNGITVFNSSFSAVIDQVNIGGNPLSPTTHTGITSFNLPAINTLPPNGTVIRYGRYVAPTPTVSTVGLTENEQAPFMRISHHPADQVVKITTSATIGELEVLDPIGKRILFIRMESPETVLNTNDWANGLYIVRLKTPYRTETTKFLKE